MTRYREERTISRRIRRLPGEKPEDFREKIRKLHSHFAQFNIDTAEICQWLMRIRPNGKTANGTTEKFWTFFLEPEKCLPKGADSKDLDRYRRDVFDYLAKIPTERSVSEIPFLEPGPTKESIDHAARLSTDADSEKLFRHLEKYEDTHRLVLLKSAAEWVVARYQKGFENWKTNYRQWNEEKTEWESAHPELTEDIRNRFTDIFRQLEIRQKRPRFCKWKTLKKYEDNCEFAGDKIPSAGHKKRHSALCVLFSKFQKSYSKPGPKGRVAPHVFERYFVPNAEAYIRIYSEMRGQAKEEIVEAFLRENPKARWFPKVWNQYLKKMNLNEEAAVKLRTMLPHCVKFTDRNKDCTFNKHTNDCIRYRDLLAEKQDLQPMESLYREWRRDFLSRPRIPSFRYPSTRNLPMPKIFGAGYHEIDFVNSVVYLRYEGMPEKSYVEFGFGPWGDYKPGYEEAQVSSVHITFMGRKARVAFRFQARHKDSRFKVSQDEIDQIRRDHPRQSQDRLNLEKARDLLCRNFEGNLCKDARVMAVDVGTTGAGYAIFAGRNLESEGLLKIIKIDEMYTRIPHNRRIAGEYKKRKHISRDNTLESERIGVRLDHVWNDRRRLSKAVKALADKRIDILVAKTAKSLGKSVEEVRKMEPEQIESHGVPDWRESLPTIGTRDLNRYNLHIRLLIRDWVRVNVARIIAVAEKEKVDLLVFESMRGFYPPGRDKIQEKETGKKKSLSFISHGQIRRKVTEKAVERGMRVVTLPYGWSSQFCGKCGQMGDRQPKKFKCTNDLCKHENDSERNAARVLGKVFWGEIILPEKRDAGGLP